MASVLLRTGEEPVTLSAQAARRLLERGDGDAALLYLALLRGQGTPGSPEDELRWPRERMDAAEQVLRELELAAPAPPTVSESVENRPSYRREDIASQLEEDPDFRELTEQVEQRLGKKLSVPELEALLRLYDHAGLPPQVIYQLICCCMETAARKYGAGRLPFFRQIEREGYDWARQGINTPQAAADYIRRRAGQSRIFAEYLRALDMEGHPTSPLEENYLARWEEWGFPAEVVAIAYERTLLRCREFKWNYCGRILENWHAAGLRTADEIEQGDRPRRKQTRSASAAPDDDELRQYIRELHSTPEPDDGDE